MAAARVLGPSLSTSPCSSLSLNASIFTSASDACIWPLFRVASSGNASAARPAVLSSKFSMASLSPCRSLNNFLTASMVVRSLAYCRIRADFISVQVRARFSLYNPPTHLENGPAAASYARRTISWSDKPYMTCFFWMDYIHSCSSVGSPLKEGNLMPPISPRNPITISGIPPSSWSTVMSKRATLILIPYCFYLPLNYKRQQKRKTQFTPKIDTSTACKVEEIKHTLYTDRFVCDKLIEGQKGDLPFSASHFLRFPFFFLLSFTYFSFYFSNFPSFLSFLRQGISFLSLCLWQLHGSQSRHKNLIQT